MIVIAGRNLALSMLCNLTLTGGLQFFTTHIYITGKVVNNQTIGVRPKSCFAI